MCTAASDPRANSLRKSVPVFIAAPEAMNVGAASSPVAGNANRDADAVFGRSDTGVRPLASVMQKLRDLYPLKTAANIAVRARVSVRAAESWLGDDRDMGTDAFIALLCSDDGFAVLEAIMSAMPKRERPRWWARQANIARLASIERSQAEQEREIRQLRLDLAE